MFEKTGCLHSLQNEASRITKKQEIVFQIRNETQCYNSHM